MNYIFNILVGIDQLINVVFGPLLNLILNPDYKFGKPDDTLSEVFGRNRKSCKVCNLICLILNLGDKNHCEKSID
jgi:hypothetical protein